jgi:hypothetical protein
VIPRGKTGYILTPHGDDPKTRNAPSIPPAWSDCVADSRLGERFEHVEEGQGGYVLNAKCHLAVIRRNRKLTHEQFLLSGYPTIRPRDSLEATGALALGRQPSCLFFRLLWSPQSGEDSKQSFEQTSGDGLLRKLAVKSRMDQEGMGE